METKSFHSRDVCEGQILWSTDAEKLSLLTGKINHGQSLKAREATTKSNWLQAHGHQEGHIPEISGQGSLALWFNSLRETEGTRGQHRHAQKGYYGNNMRARDQLEVGVRCRQKPGLGLFSWEKLETCRGIVRMCW